MLSGDANPFEHRQVSPAARTGGGGQARNTPLPPPPPTPPPPQQSQAPGAGGSGAVGGGGDGRQASRGSAGVTPGAGTVRPLRKPERPGAGVSTDTTGSATRQGRPRRGGVAAGASGFFADASGSVGLHSVPTPGSISPALFHGAYLIRYSGGEYEVRSAERGCVPLTDRGYGKQDSRAGGW